VALDTEYSKIWFTEIYFLNLKSERKVEDNKNVLLFNYKMLGNF
jgi:hypothetical protein